jgi:hypothetical protein
VADRLDADRLRAWLLGPEVVDDDGGVWSWRGVPAGFRYPEAGGLWLSWIASVAQRRVPAAAMRAAVLLGESARERGELLSALRALLDGDGPGARAEDAVRRALVEALLHDSRERLVEALDGALLGLRPRPQVTTAARVLAGG